MNETKLNGASMDIVEDNVQKLKNIFPEVFCEDSIDFEKLQAVLGNYIDTDNERYNFTWWGKSQALRLAQTPSTGTLRPCKEESKDWDTTQNLYIEGDNLEVLKLLQKTYHGKVKMIYIDPPYNTGKDFVYLDNYKDNLENYLKITGQVDNEGNRMGTNSDSSGRYHTNWLNMMYPRLRLARQLLSKTGAIFISIDDNEQKNLKALCDEVFGEKNFVCIFNRKGSGGRQDSKYFAVVHEYILCYAKDIEYFVSGKEQKEEQPYPFYDQIKKRRYKTQLLRKWGENSKRIDRPNLYYPIMDPDGKEFYPMLSEIEEGCWRWSKTKMDEEIQKGNVEFKKRDDKWQAYEKIYEPEDKSQNTKLYTTWIDNISTVSGASLIKEIFNDKVFDYPKPVELIQRILELGNVKGEDIVLDFFSGSATTANAVMKLNAEDGGNRKFIMVQLPETTKQGEEAFNLGYVNICEIGKERIRRVGEKIKEDIGSVQESLDIGFKVFKLDISNIKKWSPDYDNLEQTLFDQINNFVDGRTELDVVFEIMLKYGIDLTFPIEEYDIDGKKVYSVGFGALIICLDNDITTDLAMGIIKLREELSPDIVRVVFKDNGFKNDAVKTNVKEIFKVNGIDEMVSI